MIKTADELLMRAAEGGRVVCSGDLTLFQIAEAQACGNWYVNEHGFGFTALSWSLTTDKDKAREAGLWAKGQQPSADPARGFKPEDNFTSHSSGEVK